MQNVMQDFKNKIRDFDITQTDELLELNELKKIVQIKNKEREALLAENIRLTKLNNENQLLENIQKISKDLREEIKKNDELEKKIDKLQEVIDEGLNRSLSTSRVYQTVKKVDAKEGKSPLRPPKAINITKKEATISNDLAKKIEQAHKQLEMSRKDNLTNSSSLNISPLRYCTPPNQRKLNLSISNNK